MKRTVLALGVLVVLGCGGSLLPTPAPVITRLTPASVVRGAPELLLTVEGEDFLPGAKVKFNGAERDSLLLATSITCTLPASDLATEGTFQITVVNVGDKVSNTLDFTVTP